MDSLPRQQREYELVQLLLGDRAGFRESCTRFLRLTTAEIARQFDRDLIIAVLDREFPPFSVQWCLPERTKRPI
jgi:hypothetical protein